MKLEYSTPKMEYYNRFDIRRIRRVGIAEFKKIDRVNYTLFDAINQGDILWTNELFKTAWDSELKDILCQETSCADITLDWMQLIPDRVTGGNSLRIYLSTIWESERNFTYILDPRRFLNWQWKRNLVVDIREILCLR